MTPFWRRSARPVRQSYTTSARSDPAEASRAHPAGLGAAARALIDVPCAAANLDAMLLCPPARMS